MPNDFRAFHFGTVDGSKRRIMLDDVKIRWSHNIDHHIVVPSGFYTDFASTPSIFWWVYPPWGDYGPAAVLHDYLYFTSGLKYSYAGGRGLGPYTKRECDVIFEQCMSYDGVGRFTQKLFFQGVDKFGSKPWNDYEARNAALFDEVA